MQILNNEKDFSGDACVLALGMFDGVHIGHQALIRAAAAKAAELRVPCAVYTFDTHPMRVLFPERAPEQLISNEERADKIRRLGADVLVTRPFTREFAAMPPELFLIRLCGAMRPVHIVVGYNYTFGDKGKGSTLLLKDMGTQLGYGLTVLEAVTEAGEPVSSTRIRALLRAGRCREAEALLRIEC